MSDEPLKTEVIPSTDGQQIGINVQRDEKGRLLPGSILNPVGTKVGTKHTSTILDQISRDIVAGDPEKRTYSELLMKRLMTKAIEKVDPALINIILDRLEGKPDQGVSMKIEGEVRQSTEDIMEMARRISEELKKKKTG